MNMKRLLTLVAFFATIQASAQQVNPVPDYVFRNQMSVGRNAVTDTGAYFSIGPRYGAVKGFMPPIVSDTASVNANKRNGLLIFSVQKNKFLYWDSVRVQWSDMAGSSGSYITGKGITGYVPQFSDTATLDTSALYTLGNQLGVGTSSFAYTGSGRTVVELNGTAGGLYGFKRNDSAKGYLFHNGDNMELANTMAGSISFNTNSATRGSIASDGVWRLHNLAGTGDRVVQASSNGTLSASTSVTGLVDTLTISTRSWRQKGIDSVVSIIPAAGVGGSGTTNTIAKFSASTTIANSLLTDNAVELKYTGADGATVQGTTSAFLSLYGTSDNYIQFKDAAGTAGRIQYNHTSDYMSFNTASTERLRIFANGRVFIGASPTDAGYQLDVNGTLRSVNGANFATTSGNVGIGTTTPLRKVVSEVIAANDFNFAATSASLGTVGNWVGYLYGFAGNTYQKGATFFESIDGNARGKFHIAMNDAATSANVTLADARLTVTSAGNVGIGTASPVGDGTALNIYGSSFATIKLQNSTSGATATDGTDILVASSDLLIKNRESGSIITYTANTERGRINSAGEWIIDASGTDAGDYKLQVVGNARIGTGKLDIASNTTFGIGVARSGTSEVAGQIYNSNGILYLGAESSAGGQIFTGSSAYAAVIGSGANYPLQFATNNATRATINTNGELLINTTTDNGDFKLQVNGNGYITGNLQINPSANTTGIYMPSMSWTGSNASAAVNVSGTLNTTGAPSLIYVDVSDVASGTETNFMQFVNSDTKFRVTKQGDIQTAAPSGGTARKWKLGSVVATSVQLDTANYVEVEINGTFYRLAIVTPL